MSELHFCRPEHLVQGHREDVSFASLDAPDVGAMQRGPRPDPPGKDPFPNLRLRMVARKAALAVLRPARATRQR